MNTDYKNIFTQSSCLTNDELTNYVSGNLSVNDIRKVELHIADCQMCNDELEGLQILNNSEKLPIIVTSLNNKIDSYFNNKNVKTSIINKEKKTFNLKKTFSIAASVALLVTAAYFIYDINKNVSSENIAEVNVSDKNSLKDEKVIIESAKFEEPTIENNEVPTSNYENDKKEISSNNKIHPIKEEVTTAIESESPNELIAEISNDSEITEVSNNTISDTTKDDTIETKKEKTISESNKPIFGATRGSTNLLRNKKNINGYKYLKDSGLLAYNIKSYNDAISDFNKYLQHNPSDFEVIFKTGMSYYNIKNYNNAISKFSKITSNQKYFEDAQWYKADALLKQNKKEDALVILNTIIKNASKYSEKAKAKISEISN